MRLPRGLVHGLAELRPRHEAVVVLVEQRHEVAQVLPVHLDVVGVQEVDQLLRANESGPIAIDVQECLLERTEVLLARPLDGIQQDRRPVAHPLRRLHWGCARHWGAFRRRTEIESRLRGHFQSRLHILDLHILHVHGPTVRIRQPWAVLDGVAELGPRDLAIAVRIKCGDQCVQLLVLDIDIKHPEDCVELLLGQPSRPIGVDL
mmetsp:Transcript_83355/g.139295  ORF Transcript_83355/g.139295 Transcript_83355/m.139295 type:complete len:205 (-) Transcript_83355:139-753(-)